MEIIPVIDIMAGQAVHAIKGRRENYQPLRSVLSASADPVAVVHGLLRLHPFRTFYIADLDALMGHPGQDEAVEALLKAFPSHRFWVDRGVPLMSARHVMPVLGSESLSEAGLSMLERPEQAYILSMDFRDGAFLGPSQLLENPGLWPRSVILMNLSYVGSGGGPDFDGLQNFVDSNPNHRCVAAGGVRHEGDLYRLRGMGVSAVLLASALHSGVITGAILEKFSCYAGTNEKGCLT